MGPFLPCRWRGQLNGYDRYPCSSTKLVSPANGVTEDTCRSCPFVDHEPVVQVEKVNTPPVTPRSIWRFLGQVVSYAEAKAKWILAGSPVTPPEEQAKRKAICEVCPNFNPQKYGCGKCGCGSEGGSLLEKIRMKTETCPASPPRW